MVLLTRNIDMEEGMPQTVPSAGFTPPCDYTNFADNFDLSLLPGGDLPLSPSTLLYTQSPPPLSCGDKTNQLKIYTTYYPNSPQSNIETSDIDLGPDFQKLLVPQQQQQQNKKQTNLYPHSPVYLEVPSAKNYHANSPTGALSPYSPQGLLSPKEQFNIYSPPTTSEHQAIYPNSPDVSFYSPNSAYPRSPCDDLLQTQYIKKEILYPPSPIQTSYNNFEVKEENYLSPCHLTNSSYSNNPSPLTSRENSDVLDLLEGTPLDKQIKQESTVDFDSIIQNFQDTESLRQLLDYKRNEVQTVPEKPKDHQLLREVLQDTSFQRKYNIKPFDFGIMASEIKEEHDDSEQSELMSQEQLARENIEPVLNLAIEQMRKDVDSTCAALGISPDPSQWSSANVISWLQWTSRHFGLPTPLPEQWDIAGSSLVTLSEEEFTRRAPQSGMILHAQLEIWKAAYSEEDLGMQWMPESASSNASSGDVSDDDEEEATSSQVEPTKPSTSRSTGGSHIHLWQFLKELLASPQVHGSCIRWLDRSKGVFKIEDSVKVARLWGKRKNRPAMNYDKLSRSIRQYYKKGIMKKTERSQRLVYQFCHPYNL